MSTPKEHCFTCGGLGPKDEDPCPECGRKPKSLNLSQLSVEDVKEHISESKLLRIPEEYIGNEWSSQILWRNHPELISPNGTKNKLFERYVLQLEKVHDIFVAGGIPRSSGIIIAPSTYSKKVWAYSCMQHAMKNKHTVAPMLDTLEANRIVVLGAHDLKYKLYGEIGHDEYVMSDVLFLSVTKTDYKKDSFAVIQELLDRRSRKGLRTFVLSDVGINVISQRDYSRGFEKITKSHVNENTVKVPVIITYSEGFNT